VYDASFQFEISQEASFHEDTKKQAVNQSHVSSDSIQHRKTEREKTIHEDLVIELTTPVKQTQESVVIIVEENIAYSHSSPAQIIVSSTP
jgi:hypothetical protein